MSTNAFKNIEFTEEIPEYVKKEMLSNLDAIKLVADFVDLFFVKAGGVAGKSLASGGEENTGKRKSEKSENPPPFAD
jgi:hypothetical protein